MFRVDRLFRFDMSRRRRPRRFGLGLGVPLRGLRDAALVIGFSGCGARTLLDPFDLVPSEIGGTSFGGTSSSGGVSARGGVSPVGGGTTGGVSGSSGRGGVSGSSGAAGSSGFGGKGGTNATGGDAGAGADGGVGGEGGIAGGGGEGGSGDSPGVIGLALGAFHSCARFDNGDLRCWGTGGYIGSGYRVTIGDDETPDILDPVDIGGYVTGLAASWYQTCALLDSSRIRCFGDGLIGILGYGNTNDIGDDETPASAGDVNVGGQVKHVSAGPLHTCATLTNDRVRCWGRNVDFQLGYPSTETIGDDETPVSAGFVDVGGRVVQTAAGFGHTCALLVDGNVRCWGRGLFGRLGYGNEVTIGDDESPASAGDVALGGYAVQIVAGSFHTCALLAPGNVRCWGSGNEGALGYGNTETVGDDETPADVGFVDVGGQVRELASGDAATCAILASGAVTCWGSGEHGELGHGNTETIGDDETPASAGSVNVGGPVISIAVGFRHVCATLQSGRVRCWGRASTGALGYGNTIDIGDTELPASAGDVRLFSR
jgi:alpha-tubulin suppressor-like RCC1 family protein